MAGTANDLHTHVKAMRRYAMALTGEPSEADDLVQEALSRVLTYAKDGQEIRNLRAYLFTVLHNVRLHQLAKTRREGVVVSLSDSSFEIPRPASQDTRVECLDLVDALQRLPEEQREIILLVGLEGLTYQDAARVLDIRIGTVMSRLSRGREALRRLMTADQAVEWRRAS